MADRIAIMGGEPYAEWIEGDPVELSRGVWASNMYWSD